jgi:hypothetical protein
MTVQTLVKQYVDLKRSSGAAFQSGEAILEMFVRPLDRMRK